jgi:hypothetical protein
MTNDITVSINCKNCGSMFQPDVKTKRAWLCPSCQAKNPNLKRHYRSVADLCILGLIVTIIFLIVAFNSAGLNGGMILPAAHAVLLLVTIVFVYKSKAPWIDRAAKTLIWTVFGLALLFNVVVPLLLTGMQNIPFLIVYGVIFSYLFWLNSQANQCAVDKPAVVLEEGQS